MVEYLPVTISFVRAVRSSGSSRRPDDYTETDRQARSARDRPRLLRYGGVSSMPLVAGSRTRHTTPQIGDFAGQTEEKLRFRIGVCHREILTATMAPVDPSASGGLKVLR